MNSLAKAVARQRCGCDLNPAPSAPESSTLTTRVYITRRMGAAASKAQSKVKRVESVDIVSAGHGSTQPAQLIINYHVVSHLSDELPAESVVRSDCQHRCQQHWSAADSITGRESYLLLTLLTIIWYSITHSFFHSRLKTFVFCKSFPPQPFLFLLQDSLHGFPELFTVISELCCRCNCLVNLCMMLNIFLTMS